MRAPSVSVASRAGRVLACLLACLALALPARATWSIVLVDTHTGEVAIGVATCLEGFDLQAKVPVIVVGKGGGAAQANVDQTGANRIKIFNGLKAGTPPAEIIDLLKQGDFFWNSRQYGIADLSPAAAGFTGGAAGKYKTDVTGSDGSLTWAIQGNVLAGPAVITMAQEAILNTPGTLADRLMAGMQAAKLMGGDGRCSCSPADPDGCGSPPPSFTKSAHVACMLVARIGDTDGTCTGTYGCATGKYWMDLNVKGAKAADPDPVDTLQILYDAFRAGLAGHADGLSSPASFDDDQVLGDGTSTRRLSVSLVDAFGQPITTGGAGLTVSHAEGSAGLSRVESIEDGGDGTYVITVRAGQGTGDDLFSVRIEDGGPPATIYPWPVLHVRPALLADATELSIADGRVGLDLLGPEAAAGRPFVVLLTTAGSEPGQDLPGGLHVPLNLGRLYLASPLLGSSGVLVGSPGALDAHSRATVDWLAPAGLFAPLVGQVVSAAWITMRPADFASGAVPIALVP